jgi:hypothetical protein
VPRRKGKRFFFEKKKQKTFVLGDGFNTLGLPRSQRRPRARSISLRAREAGLVINIQDFSTGEALDLLSTHI